MFDRKQQTHTQLQTDFLSLAQADLATGDLAGALEVLRRLTLEPPALVAQSTPSREPDAVPNAEDVDAGTPLVVPNFFTNADAAAALLESTHHPVEAIPFLRVLTAAVPWSAPYALRLAQAQVAAGQAGEATPALLAVARNGTAPYTTRVAAALALAPLKLSPDLGSTELTLLARPAPSAAEAAQPGFTAAQLALAAQPGTAEAERLALLRQAIAGSPTGLPADRARIDLFLLETQTSTATPPDTLALLNLLRRAPAPGAASADATDADSSADTSADADTTDATETTDATDASSADTAGTVSTSSSVTLPAIAQGLDLSTRIHLARAMSRVDYEQAHNATEAVAYLQLAIALEAGERADAKPDAALGEELKSLQARITLDRLNAARRPVFRADLAQKVAVRPRLSSAQAAQMEAQ